MVKLISFSLWGRQPRYLVGAVENIRLARKFYPGWVCRFYCSADVPIALLLEEGAEVRREVALGPYHGLFWRFFPASEPGVKRFLVRDADSRLSQREAQAVQEWEVSGKQLHVLRDHPLHDRRDSPILAGMWGGVGGLVPDMRAMVRTWGRFDHRFCDQEFLARHLWPRFKRECLQHNGSPSSYWGGGFELPPAEQDHIGFAVLDPEPLVDHPTTTAPEPPFLTLLAIPKPFEGHIGVIQENALQSWTRLSPRPDIVLIGDEPGTAEAAKQFGAIHVPEVARNEWGTPLYHDVLMRGQQAARTELVCHVNADILLLDDLCQAAQKVRSYFSRFLMLGKRTDIELSHRLDFDSPDWRKEVHREVARGDPGSVTGVEFFLFPRWLLVDPPGFAIGRFFHDSWPIVTCRERGIPVVDATEVVTVAHQKHGYSHVSAPNRDLPYLEILQLPEDGANFRLLGGEGRRFSIRHSTHRLTARGLVKGFSLPFAMSCWANRWRCWERELERRITRIWRGR